MALIYSELTPGALYALHANISTLSLRNPKALRFLPFEGEPLLGNIFLHWSQWSPFPILHISC